MATTWSAFLAQVRRELEETTAGVWSDDSLLAWANSAGDDIAARASALSGTVTRMSVANTQSYTVATNTLQVEKLFYKDAELQRVDFSEWPEFSSSGRPTKWTHFNGRILLFPTPQTAATMFYFRTYTPTHINSTTSASSMPFSSKYDDAIALRVKQRAMEQVGDWDARDRYFDEYERRVAEAWQQQLRERGIGAAKTPATVW